VPISSSNEQPADTTIRPGPNGLTVSFEIRYIDGDEGDRIAALQTKAINALLKWLAHPDTSETAE
jgi:hypothetical protein